MGKNQSASNLTNIIKQDANGNIILVSGSTTLMSVSSSGAITTTGNVAGTASYASNAELLDGLDSTVFTLTSSFAAQTASFTAFTSSVNSYTASQNILNGTYATTGSNTFTSPQTINSNLVVTGSITAQTLVVQTITSSVDFVTGSTRFGSLLANTHVFSGSVTMNPGGLFVSSSGNVGIGTISPAYTLDVSGSLRSTTSAYFATASGSVGIGTASPSEQLNLMGANAYTSKIRFTNGASNTGYYTNFGYNSDGNRAYLQIADGATAATIMTWNYNGNVGIGTSSPSSLLQVYGLGVTGPNAVIQVTGTTNYAAYRMNNTGGDFYIGIENSTGSGFGTTAYGRVIFADGAYPLIIFSAGIERMRITSAGNVGIGTTSPGALLHIESPSVGYGTFRILSTGTSAGEASMHIGRTGQTVEQRWTYGQGTNGITDSLGWYTGGGNKATLTTAGVWSTTGGGTSDRRTKQDINYNFDNGIESILKLQPTKFKFKEAPDNQRRGFIAQDVLETIPDLVLGDGEKEDGTYGLDYDGVLAIAVKAIQELKAENDTLKEI